MPNIKINGKEYKVEEGSSVIQVCDSLDIQIPRFCYHEKLPAVGSCRMCLVQIKGSAKLVPACTTPVSEGMEIVTENSNIDSSRKTMLELLLVNHPLDCPICDQGGECDLQDQTYRYGLDRSTLNLSKRAVVDKNFGPLIDTCMTRCIHCTRCIRFAREIAGVNVLGGIGRGDHTEISTYLDKTIDFELSGNLVDVCPVGALTNSEYSFKARPWELLSTNSIDIMDATGTNTRVDCSPLAVLRISPRANDEINEEWLSDKGRYITDALRLQRLDSPMIRLDGKLQKVSWDRAFLHILENMEGLQGDEIASIAGDFVDVETMFAMKTLMNKLECDNLESRHQKVIFNPEDRASFLFNTTIAGIDSADSCLIVGSNPRVESPILNARIRKRFLKGGFSAALIGEQVDLRYDYDYLGDNAKLLQDILDGRHEFAKTLEKSKNPMLILGIGGLISENQEELIELCKKIAEKYNMITDSWNGFNVLQTSTSQINGLHVGFVQKDYKLGVDNILEDVELNKIKLLWLLNFDDIDASKLQKNTFVVYQGHHGDMGAKLANVILPSALWLEKDGMFINMEGRLQKANKAVPCVGDAKEDWKIIRKFSDYVKVDLGYNSLAELRVLINTKHPLLKEEGLIKADFNRSKLNTFNVRGNVLGSIIKDYYLSDIISRNSPKMMECSRMFNNKN